MLTVIYFLILIFNFYSVTKEESDQPKNVKAEARLFRNEEKTFVGGVKFEQFDLKSMSIVAVLIRGSVTGLTPGKHGFHIHESRISNGCNSAGGHYNPFHQEHGAPSDDERHIGDLGNIEADDKGRATITFVDTAISLTGENSIIGRSLVVHIGEDDLGKGGHSDSKTTGHAGDRYACGEIKLLKE